MNINTYSNMKRYIFLFLASLFLLQGCHWFEGKRGSEGKTGVAGLVGPSGEDFLFLKTNPTPRELKGYQNLVDLETFVDYMETLDNYRIEGTILEVHNGFKQIILELKDGHGVANIRYEFKADVQGLSRGDSVKLVVRVVAVASYIYGELVSISK